MTRDDRARHAARTAVSVRLLLIALPPTPANAKEEALAYAARRLCDAVEHLAAAVISG